MQAADAREGAVAVATAVANLVEANRCVFTAQGTDAIARLSSISSASSRQPASAPLVRQSSTRSNGLWRFCSLFPLFSEERGG
eukprot:2575131-Pleurochrysis_carterae.AAC.2